MSQASKSYNTKSTYTLTRIITEHAPAFNFGHFECVNLEIVGGNSTPTARVQDLNIKSWGTSWDNLLWTPKHSSRKGQCVLQKQIIFKSADYKTKLIHRYIKIMKITPFSFHVCLLNYYL
jgi:hypothetical protein